MAGGDVLSHRVSPAVPSALRGLTAVFGMGTGVSPALRPPAKKGRPRIRAQEGVGPEFAPCERACNPSSVANSSPPTPASRLHGLSPWWGGCSTFGAVTVWALGPFWAFGLRRASRARALGCRSDVTLAGRLTLVLLGPSRVGGLGRACRGGALEREGGWPWSGCVCVPARSECPAVSF